jgi:general secretion pathway protein K
VNGKQRMVKISQKGIALLIVLWVMAVLTVMVFSFAVMTRAESYGTLAFREMAEKRLLAEAGIERGVMEIFYWSINRNQALTLQGRELWKPDGTPHDVDMGQGGCVVRIIDEAGKISVNGLNDASGVILKNLLIHQGVSSENADIIVDSIMDWKDADDLHRLNGAESDYYLSLAKPYKARNAAFETLEELRLVRGMTPEILYGNGKTRGILPFLTIYSKADKINLNAAPREVLAALPGMDATLVERIMAFRSSAEIGAEGVVQEMAGAAYPMMAPYVSAGQGSATVFTVEAMGYKDDREKGHAVVATLTFDSPQQYRYVYYKSPAEMIP